MQGHVLDTPVLFGAGCGEDARFFPILDHLHLVLGAHDETHEALQCQEHSRAGLVSVSDP